VKRQRGKVRAGRHFTLLLRGERLTLRVPGAGDPEEWIGAFLETAAGGVGAEGGDGAHVLVAETGTTESGHFTPMTRALPPKHVWTPGTVEPLRPAAP
jgi:hypothetical protein